jgi:hypothetical protein
MSNLSEQDSRQEVDALMAQLELELEEAEAIRELTMHEVETVLLIDEVLRVLEMELSQEEFSRLVDLALEHGVKREDYING